MIPVLPTSTFIACLRWGGFILLVSIALVQCNSYPEPRLPGPDIRVSFKARALVMRKELVGPSIDIFHWKWVREDTTTINITFVNPWIWLNNWPAISKDGWYDFYQRMEFGSPNYTVYGSLSRDLTTLINYGTQYYYCVINRIFVFYGITHTQWSYDATTFNIIRSL